MLLAKTDNISVRYNYVGVCSLFKQFRTRKENVGSFYFINYIHLPVIHWERPWKTENFCSGIFIFGEPS